MILSKYSAAALCPDACATSNALQQLLVLLRPGLLLLPLLLLLPIAPVVVNFVAARLSGVVDDDDAPLAVMILEQSMRISTPRSTRMRIVATSPPFAAQCNAVYNIYNIL